MFARDTTRSKGRKQQCENTDDLFPFFFIYEHSLFKKNAHICFTHVNDHIWSTYNVDHTCSLHMCNTCFINILNICETCIIPAVKLPAKYG